MARVDARLRTKVSRCRTMRADRSASAQITSTPRLLTSSSGISDSRSAQLRIVASGLFSSCATPDTSSDRRQLLVLQQLLVQLPRAIVEPLALGGVTQQRIDQDAAAFGGLHVRGNVHLQLRLVGLAHSQQIVRDATSLVSRSRKPACGHVVNRAGANGSTDASGVSRRPNSRLSAGLATTVRPGSEVPGFSTPRTRPPAGHRGGG